ncbi:beta-galactosidase [Acidobacterium capsulatum ATCC 51196]|uniref:Beta-galactosidase n=1 Tax=Acidobacterium capsulatum (strain ATCC 51196 / DSM 11244 / BCRC 80197 / JCM 7670 / NBRC 15755 / NCIMB 13165 / 161) TaxID=240015 RepID=C1F2W3_ACIC5|nr:beta-galactosidase [Acidobacterium capsulatum ATCC 51196]
MAAQDAAPKLSVHPATVFYGAAYYNEYTPSPLHPERLATDVRMMKAAGFNVVRMGESTWSLWEPAPGKFDYAWMDRVVDAMSKAGIKVIMGTPTYSMPVWLWKQHPELLARPLGGGYVGYGMRQDMDYDNPVFRQYAGQLIVNLVRHYRNNPDVIGWQVDNETSSYGASNPDVFHGFVDYLKERFGTPEAMDRAWLLNYWGQDVYDWKNMPTRDNATNPSYKLAWSRYSQLRVTRYLAWQAQLVRENRAPAQFVTTDFGSIMRPDVDETQIARTEDVVANNIYHGWQDDYNGEYDALQGSLARSLKHTNYLVTETNAQTLGWDSAGQYPPYDGQLRLDAFTHYANGANMVEYWHWATLEDGQETYWGGVLGHDLGPNRAYREVSRIGRELKRIGPQIANLRIHNKVAILYSVDSMNGLSFMPYAHDANQGWQPGRNGGNYAGLIQQLHTALYDANVGTDFVFPDTKNFSQYKLLIVPALYVSSDALLKRIVDYVRHGGNVLMTFKSGFTNENGAVRWQLAPGPLREAAGFTYQEYSNLKHPLSLKGDPFHVGVAANQASTWAEFLQLTTAKPLAWYDHPFFGKWPAITRNHYGEGTLTYEGTVLSGKLQDAVMLDELQLCGLTGPDQSLPADLHVRHGVNDQNRRIHYYLNYSSSPTEFTYPYANAHDLLTGHALASGSHVRVDPWGVVIAEEDRALQK